MPPLTYNIAAFFMVRRNLALAGDIYAAVVNVDLNVLLGKTREFERRGHGVGVCILMLVHSKGTVRYHCLVRMAAYFGLNTCSASAPRRTA